MGEKELSLVFFPLFRMSLYVNLTLNNNNNNNNSSECESAAPNVMEEQAEAWVNGSQIEWGVDG